MLAQGVTAREEGDELFVELEAPMPVGTRLSLDGRPAQVSRVRENAGAGMWLRLGEAAHAAHAPEVQAPAAQAADAPAAQAAHAPDEPAAKAPEAKAAEPAKPEPKGGGKKRKRR